MITKQKTSKFQEMSARRWLMRYLILTTIAIVLSIKVYFMLFIIDFTVGFYSVLTTAILFTLFALSFLKYKDPFIEINQENQTSEHPLISIVIPVKNEEGNIERCVESCINSSYKNKEIIVVNDASTDNTPIILEEMKQRFENLIIIHLKKNVGKKHAIKEATKIANGEFYFFMDSDCNMSTNAVENAVKIFLSDKEIGAITAHGRVRDAEKGNLLEKIQDVWFDGQYRILKGMESSFSSLTCCSGSLSAFRREAIQPHIYDWANDRFAGIEFRFATDRRLTAFVLAKKSMNSRHDIHPPLIRENSKTRKKYFWKLKYSTNVNVEIGVPVTLRSLIKQQIRWRKSFIRSIFATGLIYWHRPLPVAIFYYFTIVLRLFRPYIIIKSLIMLPLSGDYLSGLIYLSGAAFAGLMYGIDVRLRRPGYPRWFYRPLMNLLSTFFFTWLLVYAAITIRNKTWR
ncbi:MAG: glycosyltransferase [Nitrososphaeraceae archaeon]|nr:glycosyltransferase [Nitrososphaeraceae archaeon]